MREKRNEVGNKLGFGCCQECGDSWYWKKPGSLYFRLGAGMFPICEECLNKLSDERVLEHCMERWVTWKTQEGVMCTAENFPYHYLADSLAAYRKTGNAWSERMSKEIQRIYEQQDR